MPGPSKWICPATAAGFGYASTVNVGSSGTLQLTGGANTGADTTYFNNLNVTGTGTLTKTGASSPENIINTNGGVKDFQGTINIQQGILGNNGTAWAAAQGAIDLNIATNAFFDLRFFFWGGLAELHGWYRPFPASRTRGR